MVAGAAEMAGVLRCPGCLCPSIGIGLCAIANLKFPFLVVLDGSNLHGNQLDLHVENSMN